jgi:hypothetical protein
MGNDILLGRGCSGYSLLVSWIFLVHCRLSVLWWTLPFQRNAMD